MYDYCMYLIACIKDYTSLAYFVMHVVCMSYSRYNSIHVPYIFFLCMLHVPCMAYSDVTAYTSFAYFVMNVCMPYYRRFEHCMY